MCQFRCLYKNSDIPATQSKKGVTPSKTEKQVDHVVPKLKGGSGTPNNGQVLCRDCNIKKSNKLMIYIKDNSVKVGFVQKTGEFETEAIWCEIDGDNFIVDNIPFIAKRISLGDTIKAEYDSDDEMYYFDDFVKTSGNSTIRIIFYDDKYIDSTREWLTKSGSESEVLPAKNIVAVNVPKKVNYTPICKFQ